MTPRTDPLEGLTAEEERRLEREAIQAEAEESTRPRFALYPGGPGERNIAAEVREYVATTAGSFTTQQLYSDLGIVDPKHKATARKALERLKGAVVEADGTRAGQYRIIGDALQEMDLENVSLDSLDISLPLDLGNYVSIMPGNIIVVAGGPDAGKSAFVLNVAKLNIEKWDVHYFNSEMGPEEMRKRLDLFGDFPRRHKHFHAYERAVDFQDVIRTGRYTLNIIDFLEMHDEFYRIAKHLSDIHRRLDGAIALVAIQTKTGTDMPIGGDRALEKARLALSLRGGSVNSPNVATILKAKNRKTTHSLKGAMRPYKLIQGSVFKAESPVWK
jgi:hypothetical protein